MSNIQNELSPASRAMLVGAMLGGAASVASQWKERQSGELSADQFVTNVAKDTVKAGAISGATTYVAGKMAGQPVLSLFTILAAGAAGVYMLDQANENKADE
ncbi:hypothetical protein [Vibrio sp. SCSIO 43137]|uniref:hypothetical protein n=1 Tax=Vibrio sp. SCSIO 43137 TaxID=3021011 RepID=UPI0023079324|nr:hypothetical protein [Vibrio sp. SCSIO 43137]WCE30844.1 hypothetical protein PK654_06135 [Vibrio sp. SCSIO 43137]